ncbi:MerR family transcriptional regulator [Solimonas marina]|nr:MerR family transcriptional regulator [Solimonas marina]
MNFLKIGEIASRTGLSARALRLYEQRGLLQPCTHSVAGYRLYGPAALQRLMQIALLRRSGFTLAQIGQLLAQGELPVRTVLAERLASLESELTEKHRMLQVLRNVQRQADSASTLNVDELLEHIAMTQQLNVDLSDAQRAAMLERAEAMGKDAVSAAEQAWPVLITQVRAAMDAGTPADDPTVLALARRWHALVQAATGGDPEVNRKIGEAYRQQPEAMAAHGMDLDMFRYVGAAMARAGLSLS